MNTGTRQKILLLLSTGIGLGLARTPKQYFRLIEATRDEWKKINRKELLRAIREFHLNRIVGYKENNDGTVSVSLTEKGKKKLLQYNLNDMKLKTPPSWDKKWRLVIFDIPDKKKPAREALRRKLKELGFYQFQKSIFVYPYECEDEINFIVEMFEIRKHVRLVTAGQITNEAELKLYFDLN